MTKNLLNIQQIMEMIPHRYPFLLVDRIVEIHQDKIVGIKNVTFNEPQFTGHFPSKPIMPGVLIIEAMAQLSAVLVSSNMKSKEDKEVYFMSIESTKFRRVVEPGDTLYLYSEITQNRSYVWKFAARAEVEGNIVAESNFTAMVKDKAKNE